MRSIILLAHDIRSIHNIGSLLRTADGLGIEKVYLTGYTPYPLLPGDKRLPHISLKLTNAINKTALGAHNSVAWEHHEDVYDVITQLKMTGYTIYALEQTEDAVDLHTHTFPDRCAILLGSEVTGITEKILSECDMSVVIPMFGKKESFNVVQAAAMAMYRLRFF